ncbi:MAG: type IV pilus modification PilV family protein [Planctomycetota bacterium]
MAANRSGFTLLEATLAMAVLAIAVTIMASSIGSATTVVTMTENEARVVQAMDNLLEEIQSSTYKQVMKYDETWHPVEGVDPISDRSHVLDVIVREDQAAVATITMRARWADQDTPRDFSMTFYHVNRGG